MAIFSQYDGLDHAQLTDALLVPSGGITVSNIALQASGPAAVNFYDGSLGSLGIGAGLLITSGTAPGTANTVGWFGQDNSGTSSFYNGDADIDAVVNTVFQTQSYDATTLSFDFAVADPAATSISFDLVFGSDEFPEWVDQFVDSAIVMVNGVNYALFNHDPMHPLSVVSSNLAAGYFQDNAGNALSIEYDGVSQMLKIIAPIVPGGGTNHIKIGIADTGDHIYDSGLFLANFAAGNAPGSGVVVTPPSDGTDGNDTISGSSKAELVELMGGDDICYAGGGDDIVIAGTGNDSVYGGSGADQLKGDAGDDFLDGGADVDTVVYAGASGDYTIAATASGFTIADNNAGSGSEGADTLANVELGKFSDGLFEIGADGSLTPVTDPGAAPSNTPGSVTVGGIGSVGQTLTAHVSDANGISGAVSFQWQVSVDGGATWSDVGIDSDTYTVAASDVGKQVQVIATYTDDGATAEAPVSAAKSIQQIGDGDLNVTLIHLDAPAGASVIDPLTTLVKDAIDLGLSPNAAVQAVMTVLGLPDTVDLLDYDAYAALQVDPADPVALVVEKANVEVAVLTSLSDDDSGTNLTLRILEADASGQTLDLADAHDLAAILGIDISGITDKKNYPQPLREIFDRNDNIAQAADVGEIEAEWQDFLSIQDGVASTSIADLVIHVNQAPVGSATAALAAGIEGTAYVVAASDLLAGFSDPDGDDLVVADLAADTGTVTDNGDGTFTVTTPGGFTGPVELSYLVLDGSGGSASASQMFAIAADAPPNMPTAGDDNLTGSAAKDIIDGLGGDDTIHGLDGNDRLLGNSGNDTLAGGVGTDRLDGGSGQDCASYLEAIGGVTVDLKLTALQSIGGGEGRDILVSIEDLLGSSFADSLTGDNFANVIEGDSGDDALGGKDGGDVLDGGAGLDVLSGGNGNDVLRGGNGDDRLVGGNGIDCADYAGASEGIRADLRLGSAQEISAGEGYDRLVKIENLSGSDFDDRLVGEGGDNVLTGGGGNDRITGLDGDDQLLGGSGSDRLVGGNGNDTLVGGLGDDAMNGGQGHDVFVFADGDGLDSIAGFTAGQDHLDLSSVSSIVDFADLMANHAADAGLDTTITYGAGDTITLQGVHVADLALVDFLF